jgi:hypothetical protein
MSVIAISIQFLQEALRGSKISRFILSLKFVVLSYFLYSIYQSRAIENYKILTLAAFFLWFSFWEIKKNKSTLYPVLIFLLLQALNYNEQMPLLVGIMSMSVYIYAKLPQKNNYGISNLVPLLFILSSVLLLLAVPPLLISLLALVVLLFSIITLYNPFINIYSHKTEFLLVLVCIFLYLAELPFQLVDNIRVMTIASILFAGAIFFIERKNIKLACLSQLSIHLVLMTKASPEIFLYSLIIVFVAWSIFEYISRDNNDFLSKIIILLFASDLPFTPFFIAKLKAFTVLYADKQWVSLALVILYSLFITGVIISFAYKSILTFAKSEKQLQQTPTIIYIQRIAITLFFLLYTLLPLILFKQ